MKKNVWLTAWIAFRFIVFGVGGFLLLWISAMALVMEFDPYPYHWISPYLALPMAFVGAVMMLFGYGEWGRWAYLLVFVSSPLVMFLMSVIPWPKWKDDISNKGSIILVFVLPFILTYIPTRRYYRRLDARNSSAKRIDLPGPVPEEQTAK